MWRQRVKSRGSSRKIKDQYENVENYDTSSSFDIRIGDNETGDYSLASVEVTLIEPTNEILGETKETENMDNTITGRFYVTEEVLYVLADDGRWHEEAQREDFDVNEAFSTTYNSLYHLFEKIEADLSFSEEDDYYIFSFDDTSEAIFKALEEPYNANVSGINEDEISHDLQFKIDKDSFHFIEFVDKMIGETMGGPLQFDITHDFKNINDVDEIKLPNTIDN